MWQRAVGWIPVLGLTGRCELVPGSAHGGVVRACRSSSPLLFSILVQNIEWKISGLLWKVKRSSVDVAELSDYASVVGGGDGGGLGG